MDNEVISLDDCCLGETYHIVRIECFEQKERIRLLEIGFFHGQSIRVTRKSIFKRTLLVELSDFVFSLRRDIAQQIMVKK